MCFLFLPLGGAHDISPRYLNPEGDWLPLWMPPAQTHRLLQGNRPLERTTWLICAEKRELLLRSDLDPEPPITLSERKQLTFNSAHLIVLLSYEATISVSSASFPESFAKWLFGCSGGRFRVIGDGVLSLLPGATALCAPGS